MPSHKSRNILEIVDRQARRWELQQEARRARAEQRWPVITVSREFGARGEALARLLGERTGFAVWDGELVQRVAEETGANERVLKTLLDENRRREISESIEGALMGGRYMNSDYMRRLLRLFHTIESHGASIIVGRGAQYAMDPANLLRIRVVSPLAARVQGYAERKGIDEDTARRTVQRRDHERATYIKQNFTSDVREPSSYDLVLNSGAFAPESLADIVLQAYEAKFHRRPHAPAERAERA